MCTLGVIVLIVCIRSVRLDRVTSVSIVPQAQVESQLGGDNVEMKDIHSAIQEQNFGGRKDGEEYTFRWQEKVFCQVPYFL